MTWDALELADFQLRDHAVQKVPCSKLPADAAFAPDSFIYSSRGESVLTTRTRHPRIRHGPEIIVFQTDRLRMKSDHETKSHHHDDGSKMIVPRVTGNNVS